MGMSRGDERFFLLRFVHSYTVNMLTEQPAAPVRVKTAFFQGERS